MKKHESDQIKKFICQIQDNSQQRDSIIGQLVNFLDENVEVDVPELELKMGK